MAHPKSLLLPLRAKWRHRFALTPVLHRQRHRLQPPYLELTTKLDWTECESTERHMGNTELRSLDDEGAPPSSNLETADLCMHNSHIID